MHTPSRVDWPVPPAYHTTRTPRDGPFLGASSSGLLVLSASYLNIYLVTGICR